MRFRDLELKASMPIRQQPDDVWQQLLLLADRASPAVRRRFLQALEAMRDGIDVQAVEAALARGDITAVVDAVPWDELTSALQDVETSLDETRARAFDLERGAAAPALDAQQLAIHLGERATPNVSFHHVSGDVLQQIRANGAARITGITDSSRAAVRQMLEASYVAGEHPKQLVPRLRETIGLSARQQTAVARYEAALVAENVPAARVEKLVARYTQKLIKGRAALIARTEAQQALNEGQRATWTTLVAKGLLDPNAWEREWVAIVPTDGRTCPICESLDGARAPLNGTYPDPGGVGPIQHPDCRCVEKLVPRRRPDPAADITVDNGAARAVG